MYASHIFKSETNQFFFRRYINLLAYSFYSLIQEYNLEEIMIVSIFSFLQKVSAENDCYNLVVEF